MSILLGACFSLSVTCHAGQVLVDSVAAIVNGDIITHSDETKYKTQLKKGTIVDDLFGDNTQEMLGNEKKLLDHMINEKLVDDQVKKENLSVTIERVEQEITSIQERNGITRDQLIAELQRQGTNFSDYQDFIKKRLERQSLIQKEITSKIKINDEDIMALYEARNKEATVNSFQYSVAHILFREGKRSDAEQKQRAVMVYQKLKHGGNFETLASEYSEDPNFNEGGYLGTFKSGEFLKPLEEAVKLLTPGEVSQPVKTKMGYEIVKLLDRKVVLDSRFEEQKEKLRAELSQKAFVKQFQFWLAQQRQDAFIKIN